ncbi:MAG: hypothetical protein H0U28_11635 [Nocardioidaceae bacterium]|nr:hypothetical protein [Nocardioidaceae bacterium]
MAETRPIARSPITPTPPEVVTAGWSVSGRRSKAALTVADCTPLTKVTVKAPRDGVMAQTLEVRLGRAERQVWPLGSQDVAVLVIGSGPGEWLAVAPAGEQPRVVYRLAAAAAESGELVTVVDVTHGRALVRLSGARSADLLAKECGVDLADTTFPSGAGLRSAVAGLATDLVRDDKDGARSYLLHCERSSGQYLFDALTDAGAEFGIDTDGFVPPGI